MLRCCVVFLVIAVISGLFGFAGVGAGAAHVGKIAFLVFILCADVTLILAVLEQK